MYFFYFFLRLGHRPCVFVGFPIDQYRAAKAEGPKDVDILGDTYLLLTNKHKTVKTYGDASVHLDAETFERLTTFVEKLRPKPADPKSARYLWLNAQGTCVSHVCEAVKEIIGLVDGGQYSPSAIRHALATVGYNA